MSSRKVHLSTGQREAGRLLSRTILAGALAALIGGCVTMQGPAGVREPSTPSSSFSLGGLGDMFSSQVRELKALVGASKLAEADDYFNRNADYFEKRYKDGANPVLPELVLLSEHVWKTRYAGKLEQTLSALGPVTSIPEKEGWPALATQLQQGNHLTVAIKEDRLLKLTKQGVTQRDALLDELIRVEALARQAKPQAVRALTEPVLATGAHDTTFVGTVPLVQADFLASPDFQASALSHLQAIGSIEDFAAHAQRLGGYLSTPSKEAVDRDYVERVRRHIYADGRVSLDEVGTLSTAKTPFANLGQELRSMVKIGYVDLVSKRLKGRHAFDFEVTVNHDTGVDFEAIAEDVPSESTLRRFDFVFVVDLSAAKVDRDFKSRQEVPSRFQSGTREVSNPDYVGAMTNYQTALTQFQRAQLNSAIPKVCQGWGCVLQGIAEGIDNATARSRVDQASAVLASTPQTVALPIYSDYTYQTVDISATKSAQVDYLVLDVKSGQSFRHSLRTEQKDTFLVAYNVRAEDPDKHRISLRVTDEQEVANWEKQPVSVALSSLFSAEGLRAAVERPLGPTQRFLQALNAPMNPPATPTYATVAYAPTSTNPSIGAQSAQTIADERFDSVVVLRAGRSTGAGFYVTPDLILTSHHVVKSTGMVEITFYDGTKSHGRVVDHDVRLDLALIRPQASGKPLKIHEGPLRLGETVEAIGHPKGYEFTITRGVISAVRKHKSAAIASSALVEFVQTDTPISPGNSGGPLLQRDVVIGVNDWARVDKAAQNLNFSVSFNEIRSYLSKFQNR